MGKQIWHWPRNMLLLKNPQFLHNQYEIKPKWPAHVQVILAKFRNDWVKIVDFLVKAYFWASDKFASPYCIFSNKVFYPKTIDPKSLKVVIKGFGLLWLYYVRTCQQKIALL